MEVLHTFGFNAQLFLAQVVNFLILAYIFKRFLYKPLLAIIKKRKDEIELGLRNAEDAKVALERAETEQERIISKANIEAKKIISDTKESAEALREEILSRSRAEAEKIVMNASAQAELELARVASEGEKIAVALAASLLEKTLGTTLDAPTREKIVKKSISEIKKYEN